MHSSTTTMANAAAMASPRINKEKEEIKKKMEDEKPLHLSMPALNVLEEVRRCDLKPKDEIKRTA